MQSKYSVMSMLHPLLPSEYAEHHAIFECSAYATTRQMFSDLFPSHASTVSQFLNQPDCNRLAKFLTWIRMLRLNTA